MDGLTFLTLAQHVPDRALLDEDGDLWHARCYRHWLDREALWDLDMLNGARLPGLPASPDHCDSRSRSSWKDLRCFARGRCKCNNREEFTWTP